MTAVDVQFLKTKISHGNASTHFRCVGIFNDNFIAYLPLNVAPVKKF